MTIKCHRELIAYQKAFEIAKIIHDLSKAFPPEERYSLTDQVRRSSRAVCAMIAEAWRRRKYAAAFKNKLNEAEAEAAEVQVWLEFAEVFGYLQTEKASDLSAACDEVLSLLVSMRRDAIKWCM